jgi:S-DNA-T family DNA segregation ATPase FtsK/SpoIIIE
MSILRKIKGLLGSKDVSDQSKQPQALDKTSPRASSDNSNDNSCEAVSVEEKRAADNEPRMDSETVQIIPGDQDEEAESMPGGSGDYIFPPILLLKDSLESTSGNNVIYADVMQSLIHTLEQLDIKAIPHEIHEGPIFTRYQIILQPSVTYEDLSKSKSLLAQSLGLANIRVVQLQNDVYGVVLPNDEPQDIFLRDIIETKAWAEAQADIPVVLGKDHGGSPIIQDLHKVGHLLVVGSTGSGKTSFIQTALSGLMYYSGPEDLRLIIADSKILEYSSTNSLPHMLLPVVTEAGKVPEVLKWVTAEMEARYQLFTSVNVKNIAGFNARACSNLPHDENLEIPSKKLPYVVCIIDDLLDFYDYAKKDIETVLERLLRLSAVTGIHLIISTDSLGESTLSDRVKQMLRARLQFTFIPSASETITNRPGSFRFMPQGHTPTSNGTSEPGYVYIMRNDSLPTDCFKIGLTRESPERRASELSAATGVPTEFEVVYYRETADCRASESAIHKELSECRVSRNREFFNCSLEIAIDTVNRHCESHLGSLSAVEGHAPCPLEDELTSIIEFLKENNDPPYFITDAQSEENYDDYAYEEEADGDELLPDAIDVLRSTKRASTSMLQRRLRIGYNRAAQIMEELEDRGIVGPENGASPREILIDLDSM